MTPRRALLSVFDKRGLAGFARGLSRLDFEILSTGGTLRALADAGVPAVSVSQVTGFPEILDGRVKTLHPAIHGGILADRGKPAHAEQLAAHGLAPIDLVAVNLYPFRETVAVGASFAQAIEMIDIGGPAMVRAAAKNHDGVAVVVDPADYEEVLAALQAAFEEQRGIALPAALRRHLAAKAFRHTAEYDAAVADWLEGQIGDRSGEPSGRFPERWTLALERVAIPRYGENPHQAAAVYRRLDGPGVLGGFRQLGGKDLSYNNLLDADAARRIAASFAEPAVAIVKHNNPCGVAVGSDLATAFARALATDPVSAYGGIVAANRPADGAFAAAVAELFAEVVVAPGFEDGALARLAEKKNLRILDAPSPTKGEIELRSISGGLLAQAADDADDDPASWTCPTQRKPEPEERRALDLAWRVARYVKSNAIVLADAGGTVGIGAGQMSRVDSCRLAVEKARLPTAGTAAASDAYFPFRDGLDVLAAAGVRAIVHPGGSKRDPEVVAAADEHGIAMLLTGVRHFRH
jgi:phosphoribosylaminoimidazolecarboxamide formyltransferase/IMP cyclohydrolase